MLDVAILDMGGTINGILDPSDPPPAQSLVIDYVTARQQAFDIHVRAEQVAMKDSRAVRDSDRELLRVAIQASKEQAILIPHGTFTLAATGEYLSRVLPAEDQCRRIVLVGAKHPLHTEGSDAPHRLAFAIDALRTAEPGVWVAMEDKLWRPEAVEKDLNTGRFVSR